MRFNIKKKYEPGERVLLNHEPYRVIKTGDDQQGNYILLEHTKTLQETEIRDDRNIKKLANNNETQIGLTTIMTILKIYGG